jgi:hypothetical protein
MARRRRRNPAPLIVPIAALAGVGVLGTLAFFALRKDDAPAPGPGVPSPSAPKPAPVSVVVAPGALPLDADGNPTAATRQFLADSGNTERAFGPVLEATRDANPAAAAVAAAAPVVTEVAPGVLVGPDGQRAADVFTAPGGSQSNPDQRQAVAGESVTEPAGFFDPLFSGIDGIGGWSREGMLMASRGRTRHTASARPHGWWRKPPAG